MSDNDDAEGGERTHATEEEAAEPAEPERADEDGNRASFSPWDELQEAFGDTKAMQVVVDDGLPTVRVSEGNDAHAPALSVAEFCCLEDTSQFVIRGPWREIAAKFEPKDVQRAPDGRYRVKIDVVLERLQLLIARMRKEAREASHAGAEIDDKTALSALLCSWRVQNALGARRTAADRAVASSEVLVAQMVPAGDPDWVEVEPLRAVCAHLVLQLGPLTDNEKAMGYSKGWLQRFCSVRRTVAGSFMRLTDDAMRACNVRDPIDSSGLELMREMDEVQVERSATRVMLPLFRGSAAAVPENR